MSTKFLVLDVSRYQGNINWKEVAEAGLKGVILRAGYRGYGSAGTLVVDQKFQEYVENCIKYNIPYGVYVFSQAITVKESQEEANLALSLVRKQSVQPLFPIYIDSEYGNTIHTGRADRLTKATRTTIVKAFCETIEEAGYYAGVYASTSWFNNQLADTNLSSYTHWVAHYANACGYKGNHDMWQYTSSHKFPGISGRVDANWCYKDFPNIIKKVGLNGYKVETPVKLSTVSTSRAVSEHATEKFKSLAKELDINLEITEDKRYYIKTEPITAGDVKHFTDLAKALIEEVNVKEV